MEWSFDRLAGLAGRADGEVVVHAADDQRVPLRVEQATPDGRGGGSVDLVGPVDLPLGQATHAVEHDGHVAPLFLVPRAEDLTTRRYEAVFG